MGPQESGILNNSWVPPVNGTLPDVSPISGAGKVHRHYLWIHPCTLTNNDHSYINPTTVFIDPRDNVACC